MKFLTPEFIIALVGRGVEYLSYVAITYGCWLVYPPAGWIVGGVLLLQSVLRPPAINSRNLNEPAT